MHKLHNITLSNEVLDIFPLGEYQIHGYGQDKIDSKIFFVNISLAVLPVVWEIKIYLFWSRKCGQKDLIAKIINALL